MEGPFSYSEGFVPNMDAAEIWSHVRELDPNVYWSLANDLDEDQRNDKPYLLRWLFNNHPVLYDVLQDILRCFQSAYHIACETRTQYVQHYHRWRVAKYAFECMGTQIENEVQKTAENKEKEKRGKKGRDDEKLELLVEEAEHMRQVAKKVQKTLRGNEDYYMCQENWHDDFPLKDYRHYVAKGKQKFQIAKVADWGIWRTIYHCNGPWNAEQLVESIMAEGDFALIIKRVRGADAEVLGYKVLRGTFEPPQGIDM